MIGGRKFSFVQQMRLELSLTNTDKHLQGKLQGEPAHRGQSVSDQAASVTVLPAEQYPSGHY